MSAADQSPEHEADIDAADGTRSGPVRVAEPGADPRADPRGIPGADPGADPRADPGADRRADPDSRQVTEAPRGDITGAPVEIPNPVQREARVEHVGRYVPFVAGAAAVVIAAILGLIVALRADGMAFDVDEEWAEDIFTL